MKKQLEECLINKEWVCIYEGTDHESFIFGMVLSIDDRYCVIHRFDPSGSDDGVLLIEVDSIFRIEVKNKYTGKMQRLISSKNNVNQFTKDNVYSGEDYSCLATLLNMAKTNERIVSIELLASGITDIVGQVQSIFEGKIIIRQIDEYGEVDGMTICMLDDITQLSAGSEDERIREKLVNM